LRSGAMYEGTSGTLRASYIVSVFDHKSARGISAAVFIVVQTNALDRRLCITDCLLKVLCDILEPDTVRFFPKCVDTGII
jgi:hypothetical protein